MMPTAKDFHEAMLNEGALNVGDIVTFGKYHQKWIVEKVVVAEGKIQGFTVRPCKEK